MKSPFAILLATVVLIGVAMGVAAIVFLGPTNQDDSDETIPIASESDLPTPSTRNAPTQSQSEVGTAATSVATEDSSPDELPTEIPEPSESDEEEAGVTIEAGGGRGFGGGPGGGPDAADFQAIQEAMESNPEIQELIQKAESGTITQADQIRLQELMQEILADVGIEGFGDGPGGGGFGAPPTQGTISEINGSIVTIDHADESGLSTDVEITDNTDITVINELTPADLTEGTNVAGSVQRGEGGRIFIIDLVVIPEQQGGPFGGLFGAGPPGGGDATNLSNINGTIAEINDQQISVETAQGTLRLTVNEESTIISTSPGSLSDINQGMAAIAFGGNPDNTPIQPGNLIVGPEALLEQGNTPGARVPRNRQGVQGQ